MNRVELIGRLATDVDLKFTPSGLAMARVTIAVDRPISKEKREQDKKDKKPTADFPRLLLMGKTAENASKYLKKGALVAVEGSVRTSSYDNAEGQKVYATEFMCERVHFLEQGRRNESDGERDRAFEADTFEIEEVAF